MSTHERPAGPGFGMQLRGIGFWASGLPGLEALRAFVRDGVLPDAAPSKPSPQLLAPNERRRAPDTVVLALEAAQAACAAAGADPAALPSVFASTHGDLAITDYMCATLAGGAPQSISPTRFHNSVHNAAAGYWTIGTGCHAPATAISAYEATFAQALVESAAQLQAGSDAVLLVAYDAAARGPLATMARSDGLLAAALVLAPVADGGAATPATTLSIALEDGEVAVADSALVRLLAGNAMAPMLPLLEALARGESGSVLLPAGPSRRLRVDVSA